MQNWTGPGGLWRCLTRLCCLRLSFSSRESFNEIMQASDLVERLAGGAPPSSLAKLSRAEAIERLAYHQPEITEYIPE